MTKPIDPQALVIMLQNMVRHARKREGARAAEPAG